MNTSQDQSALLGQLRERFGDHLNVTTAYGITTYTVGLIRMVVIDDQLRLAGGLHDAREDDVDGMQLTNGALGDDDLDLLEVMLAIHMGQSQLSLTSLRQDASHCLAPGQEHMRNVYRFAALTV